MDLEPGTPFPSTIICTDQDFQTALTIASVLETHAAAVYQQMPKIGLRGKRLTFFEKLPNHFDRKTFSAIAKELDFAQRQKDTSHFKEKLLDFDYNDFKKRGIS